jgi:uncharacterized phage-like protein YoqJ
MIIAATGHRPEKLNKEYDHKGPVSRLILSEIKQVLIQLQPEKAICGMALGVDMIFAVAALRLSIPLIAAIPFKGQESKWPRSSQDQYHQILSHRLVTIHYVCDPGYAAWKMQKRNEWMVDRCTNLLGVWDRSSGGTANCIEYAQKVEKPIIYLYLNPDKSITRSNSEKYHFLVIILIQYHYL